MYRLRFRVFVRSMFLIPFLLILVLPLSRTEAADAKKPEYELSLNINYNLTQSPGKACLYFADQINKRSNGRVKITVYGAGTLTPPNAVYESVITGIADLGTHTVVYTPGRFLAIEATHVPYSFQDGWVSSHVNTDFVNHFMPKEVQDTHFLFASAPGPYAFLTTKNTPDVYKTKDLVGRKVRAGGSLAHSIVKAYGGTPMSVTVNETFEAAAKNMIDIIFLPMETLKGFNFADITKSVTIPPVRYCSANITVMSLNKWNSLPKDIQDLFTEVASEMPDAFGQAWWYSDITALDYFAERNGKVIEVPPQDYSQWADPIKFINDEYIAKAKAKGLPGEEYLKYIQERAKYYNENHTITKEQCVQWYENELLNLK